MIKLGVIFGGKSCEHDVSIITGQQFIQNIDKSKYQPLPIYISRDGKWYVGEKLMDTKFMATFDPTADGVTEVYLSATSGIKALRAVNATKTVKKGLFGSKEESTVEEFPVDVVINAVHGLHGEDGTIAGLLELADIPYGSTGVMGSSVGMDKIAMKAVFRANGFPVLDDMFVERNDYHSNTEAILNKITEKMEFPIIVKPANLGSSIGITLAKDRAGLEHALNVAFSYDRRVLVEKGISNLKEVNCSCLGYSDDVKASTLEMPVTWEDILSFDAKYLAGGKNSKSSGMASLSRQIPAPISDEMTKEIQETSINIFKALDCKGVVRIDYLIDCDADKAYVGEINTQPGSFAFYLWEETGVTYKELIDKLVEIAFESYEDKNANNYAFDSEILTKVSFGGTKGAKGSKMGTKF